MQKFNIDEYVNLKIEKLSATSKTFKDIFSLMFENSDYVMFEKSNGSKITKVTYKECLEIIKSKAVFLNNLLKDIPKGEMIGLYAQNSQEWVEIFWCILMCGYKPLLMNTRLDKERIEETLSYYKIEAIISDSETFKCKTINISDIVLENENSLKIESWADEIIVMSSGTTDNSKLCVYSGENFFYQLLDSANIIKQCKQMKKHYNGELKQLMFLPLYHIFGLAAMFMWFAFFNRTFVLLKDQNPDTILFTIKKHKVTHIFAVPLFWETVYKKFLVGLKKKGEKTVNKFNKGMAILEKTKSPLLSKLLFKEVRDNLFGESICFLISGGSNISPEILKFFNFIGYHLANGYGMSEIGITSVELSSSFKNLTDCSVGKPFTHIKYKIGENGELWVKGKSTAKEILLNGKKENLNDGWYNTLDLVREENGRYFICGRQDDMLVGIDGENINPNAVEHSIVIPNAQGHVVILKNKQPTLVIKVNKFLPITSLGKIKEIAQKELERIKVSSSIKNIAFTHEDFIKGNEFKLNRTRLQNIKLISEEKQENNLDMQDALDEISLNIIKIFASVLNKKESEISLNSHFFFDLNGTSLDYFSLIAEIESAFGVCVNAQENNKLYTVQDFKDYIQNKL